MGMANLIEASLASVLAWFGSTLLSWWLLVVLIEASLAADLAQLKPLQQTPKAVRGIITLKIRVRNPQRSKTTGQTLGQKHLHHSSVMTEVVLQAEIHSVSAE